MQRSTRLSLVRSTKPTVRLRTWRPAAVYVSKFWSMQTCTSACLRRGDHSRLNSSTNPFVEVQIQSRIVKSGYSEKTVPVKSKTIPRGHSSCFAFPLPLAGKMYGRILAYNISRRVGSRNDLQINCRRNVIQRVIFAGSAADIQVVEIRRQWQRIYCDVD